MYTFGAKKTVNWKTLAKRFC